MPYLVAAVVFVGLLCAFDLILTLAIVRRLREHAARAFGHPAFPSFYVVDEGTMVTASLLSPSGLPVSARA
ncbi:hypothetical protein [Actinoallomurus sp. CA-150999]|uniref:hypothetical protein n=1 Tax=Actinoallomurus sp. CA-150999 TaxID=3239887 RepID=UPI003D912F10